ncbi:hypothetical protein NU195Hw_g1064t1 [Hortaea werneckii]
MHLRQVAALGLATLTSLVSSAAVPAEPIEVEERQVADGGCSNGPYTRMCWGDGYSIATDFDQKFPTTGNTVTYDLEISNGTCNPDGNGERLCLLINNQYPGPLIRASWGDNLVINVKNSMQDNGTSIHWHGVRQYHTTEADGVNGLTECPLAPGDTKTYSFQVTQFGTSWYHSHFSSQYGDGVVGPMIFDGPASSNYDHDLGPYVISDWYYPTAYQINSLAAINLQSQGPPPPGDTILINGTNKNANGGGQYNKVTMQKGKKYRLRLINTSVDNYIRVSLDGHNMTVMTTDFIPVKPFDVQTILIGIGQRYDVVIKANQASGNYWFRANVASDCLSANNFYAKAIWSYSDAPSGEPTTSGHPEPSDCKEPSQAAPYWVQPVPSGTFDNAKSSLDVGITQAQFPPGGDSLFVWALGNSSMNVDWEKPTLQYFAENNDDYETRMNVHYTTNEGKWNYWLIQQDSRAPPVPHPIHLHGHDFFVLGQGSGSYTPDAPLNYATPPRRDTATVPGGGWLAIAFLSNNPGAWLMHCHIAWHVAEGLAVQFVESPEKVTFDQNALQETCTNWKNYYDGAYWHKDDSGI